MDEYAKLTRAELIARLQALERKPSRRKAAAPRKSVPHGLHDTEERLRAILRTAVEGIITIDEQGIVESINPAAERIFGFSSAEVVGQNVSRLMPAPYRQEHDAYMANYLRTGKARIIGIGREVVGQRKDGTVFPMDLAVSEVRLEKRRLFTGFIRDISERKRLERQLLEISDRERQRIGQDLHDDLCQHLAGIELMSQVLEQKLSKKSKTDAARAADISRHVREAISQTRSLARGLSPVTLESEGLASALQELATSSEKMFGIACRVECEGPVLLKAPAALTHLYRIAQEAVSNAVRHGKASQVYIRLESSPSRTVLRVTDNGTGFLAAGLKSNGMGLRIMRYRAGMIGGVLSIEAAPAGGTVLTCSVANASAQPSLSPEI